MKYGVSRNTLLKTAGLIWLIAGLNILRIGLECWTHDTAHQLPFKIGETTLVFILFAGVIFQKIYRKHTRRISGKGEKNCPFAFFDAKGWIIMAFMISVGYTVRKFQLLPETAIGVFYTGLSLALMLTGIRFILFRSKQTSSEDKLPTPNA